MTFVDWIIGVLFRPAATFDRAREHLRFGYWWILLSVFTLEAVMTIYSPLLPGQSPVEAGDQIFTVITWLLILVDVQALLFMLVARGFKWPLKWPEALKYVGLLWSLILVEDFFAFYPSLQGMHSLTLLISVPFILWYMVALTAGIQRLSGISFAKALLMSAITTLPFRVGLLWMSWSTLTGAN